MDHNSSLPHVVIDVFLVPNLLQASHVSHFKKVFSSKLQKSLHALPELQFLVSVIGKCSEVSLEYSVTSFLSEPKSSKVGCAQE